MYNFRLVALRCREAIGHAGAVVVLMLARAAWLVAASLVVIEVAKPLMRIFGRHPRMVEILTHRSTARMYRIDLSDRPPSVFIRRQIR